MPRGSQETPPQAASGSSIQRMAKPNVFKSLNWEKELNRILKKNAMRIPAALTRREIQRRFYEEADCGVLTLETISLKCPVSKKRIQVAAKGADCRHLQCFDLSAFIQVRVCSSRWYCPVCGTETKLAQLRINEFVNEIVRETDPSVERVELLCDGTFRPIVQTEIDPDVKINDELPYVPSPKDAKPGIAEGGQALSVPMRPEREPLVSSAMTAGSEREDASVLEDVKPLMPLQSAPSDHVEPEVLSWHNDEAEEAVLEDVKPVVARIPSNSTYGESERRTYREENGNLTLQLEASHAEVQRISQELHTEQATRLGIEQKISQLQKDLDDAKARFDELRQKRAHEDFAMFTQRTTADSSILAL